jgi:hypothetical protein
VPQALLPDTQATQLGIPGCQQHCFPAVPWNMPSLTAVRILLTFLHSQTLQPSSPPGPVVRQHLPCRYHPLHWTSGPAESASSSLRSSSRTTSSSSTASSALLVLHHLPRHCRCCRLPAIAWGELLHTPSRAHREPLPAKLRHCLNSSGSRALSAKVGTSAAATATACCTAPRAALDPSLHASAMRPSPTGATPSALPLSRS